MKRIVFVFSLVLAIVAVSALPSGATHAWGSYHWARAANPVPLTVHDSVVGDWDATLGPVVTDWDASDVLTVTSTPAQDSLKVRKRCQPVSGALRACNASYGFNGWLGLAQIWVSGGHITQGTAKVNDSYFNTGSYNNPSAKRHVLCQEVGHAFGLGHQHGEASCMDDTGGLFDPAYVSPGAHDYEQLTTIYSSHLDTAAATPDGPGNSGTHASGRSTVRVERDGDQTLVTVIIWA